MHKARLAKIDCTRHSIERDLIVKWKDSSSNIYGFQQSLWHDAKRKIKKELYQLVKNSQIEATCLNCNKQGK